MGSLWRVAAILLALLLATTSTQGATIILSQYVSDGPSPPPAEDLDATFEFLVDSPTLPATLTFSVENQTTAPADFNMNELYFNAPANVTGMSITSGGQDWALSFDNTPDSGFQVNGFGLFDVAMIDGPGWGSAEINPGETHVFEITLSGSGPISDTDFITEFSEGTFLLGGMPMIAAAKFVQGPPNDLSAYGATPEPGSLVLLTLGGLALTRRKRRQR